MTTDLDPRRDLMRTHAIAAFIAEHAPLRAESYAHEDGTPKRAETDCECAACYTIQHCIDDGEAYICADRAACNARSLDAGQGYCELYANHSPFYLAFEQSERELGEALGYPALVYEGQTSWSSDPARTQWHANHPAYEEIARLNRVIDNDMRGLLNAAQEVEVKDKVIEGLRAACDEAHATLFHYDLARQPDGVDWGPVAELREKLIERLWQAILLVQPERNP